ncbi:TIGR03663 family protein [Halobaculum sp. CBA1158]|uniref:flippase activity-associated protein Agl23 n=1 Tax=Halobaculum sp. CBA1158 TaxID=2904243 RepID=UPI001F1DF3CF|nr:flippase activity-associated protein Agl23 [Halobaculum sp. CBA1158]UIO99254.1 TIGR03663 family protein [Halobaculum sp. CBA1158]
MSDGDREDRSRPGRLDGSRVAVAVAAVVALALLARAVFLDARPFHWHEGRAGYWSLRYLDTGVYSYRPALGGPLVHLGTARTIAALGRSDAAARAFVAVVGGLLPAAALLFRGTLRDDETVALAALLAGSPLLIYYSRFLRGDVPAAAFGLVAVGGVVRHRDTGARWPLYLSAAAFALALGSSGFAVAYPVVWLVAAAFVFDEARVRGVPAAAFARATRGLAWLRATATPLARAAFVFLGVALLLFAPRGGGVAPGLWDPSTLPTAVSFAVSEAPERFVSLRFAHRLDPPADGESFIPAVVGYARTLVATAWPALGFGILGFLVERYRSDTRGVVAFGGYAAGFGLLVFPVVALPVAPWSVVHVVPLLALPGAVGLARVARWAGARATPADPALLLAVLLVASAGLVGYGGTAAGVYAAPEPGSPYAQFAQPSDDLDPMIAAAEAAIDDRAGDGDGSDVVYVGRDLHTGQEYALPPVERGDREAWGARLPLQWYFERMGAESSSVLSAGQLAEDPPPVVVTTPDQRVTVTTTLDGYEQYDLRLGLWDRTVVVFVEE